LQLLMPTYDLSIPEQADFFAQLVEDAANMALPAFTEIAISLSQWNRFTDAKRLTLPTLLLWGDQDSIVNRDAMTRTLIAIPGANNLEILHGVGHTPQIEAPLVLAEKIIEFITEDFTNFNALRQQAYTK
jgi:pimeloyl-ACP methyl ester carboxylesterase